MYRRKVFSKEEYLGLCRLFHRSKASGHVSVYSDFECGTRTATCLYYDIDGEDMLKVGDFTNKFVDRLEQWKPTVVFTGGVGYHLFIEIPPTQIADLEKAGLTLLEWACDGFEWETNDAWIDRQRMKDWRSMCCIPFTYHRNTKELSRIVRKGYITQFNLALANKLAQIKPRVVQVKQVAESLTTSVTHLTYLEVPPCITEALNKISETGELDHNGRIHLAAWLIRAGFSDDEAASFFTMAKDYSHNITSYQIKYLRERNIKCYSCEKALELGVCPRPCQYQPSLNRTYFKW